MIELIGLLLPPLIDFINKKISNDIARFWMSVLVCMIVGTGIDFITTNGWEGFKTMLQYADSISKSIIMTFGWAQFSFQAYWKHTGAHEDMKPY